MVAGVAAAATTTVPLVASPGPPASVHASATVSEPSPSAPSETVRAAALEDPATTAAPSAKTGAVKRRVRNETASVVDEVPLSEESCARAQ